MVFMIVILKQLIVVSQTVFRIWAFRKQSTKVLNLTILQRIDPHVEEILITAAHVTFYEFNIELNQWSRKDVEGSLFVVKRNTQPRFQFIVMNRRNAENLVEDILGDFEYEIRPLVEDILGDFEYEIQPSYLLYRNAAQEVNGIWFYNQQECEVVAAIFQRSVLSGSKTYTSCTTHAFPVSFVIKFDT
ncbi:mRNA-decapping enzyme-like protein isoform X1 [Asparagus officinalis]|uniref:mRNA-decapping enzyme-like protein isoform X1 n=1 Tax=Asparagus officinalis TaxID=4686 RepID=UPI00098DEF97|nr:mRNA-decapping enzyme-like protein isoform X1 [Asparagus officinalis]